jgi:hypothetical protein
MCAIKEIRVRSLRATILTAFLFAIGTVAPSAVTANAATTPACVTSSGSWVNSALPQTQTGTFQLTFDATPASTDIDGVIGVSSGPASAYASLAAIIRFNSTGTIDAMNGTAYTAATPIAYTPGTTYHFILNINIGGHTYNASVVVGGVQMVIGSQLAFRAGQATVSSLNDIGSMTTLGSQAICNVAVTTVPAGLSITTQPVSQSVTAGQTANFSVAAAGTAPLTYQWRKNGAAVSGATSSAYVTPATVISDNGALFTTVVTNSAGSATSNSATLTVIAAVVAPSITTQPISQSVTAGQTATFSVADTGTAPLSYQWRKNGTAIGGATSSAYLTPATVISDNGALFTAVVTNSAGSATSNSATLTVIAAVVTPSITTQPVSQSVTAGQTASFSVTAAGTAPLRYQWMKGGAAIGGATSSAYLTPATVIADNGALFTVVVTNSAGSATSNSATLTVKATTLLLNASPTQLSFGSVNVSSNGTQSATLTNAGNSNVTISNVIASGAGFSAGGGTVGLILTPGQAAPVTAIFAPLAAGNVTGSVTVTSNSPTVTITLAGTGMAQASHSVSLSWTASKSEVIGYNVYSGGVSGGPYVKLTASPTPTVDYVDATVQSAQTYYYVVTAVGSNDSESTFSTEVKAVIP